MADISVEQAEESPMLLDKEKCRDEETLFENEEIEMDQLIEELIENLCNEGESGGVDGQDDEKKRDGNKSPELLEVQEIQNDERIDDEPSNENHESNENKFTHESNENKAKNASDQAAETSSIKLVRNEEATFKKNRDQPGAFSISESLVSSTQKNNRCSISSDIGMSSQEWNELSMNSFNAESRAMQESLSITHCTTIPFTEICDIKSFPQVPYRFRCRARVLHYEPTQATEILQVGCDSCDFFTALQNLPTVLKADNSPGILRCTRCSEGLGVEFVVSFMLEDNTGILNVLLCGEEASTFLSSFEIATVLCNAQAQKEVEEKLAQLTLGEANSLKDLRQDISSRPYIECGIQSYYGTHQQSADNDAPIVCYQIFDTVLI